MCDIVTAALSLSFAMLIRDARSCNILAHWRRTMTSESRSYSPPCVNALQTPECIQDAFIMKISVSRAVARMFRLVIAVPILRRISENATARTRTGVSIRECVGYRHTRNRMQWRSQFHTRPIPPS